MAKKKKAVAKKSSSFKLTINWSKWLIASIAVFVVMFGLDYLIHGKLLMNLYTANANLMLPTAQGQARMGYMLGGQLLFAAFFVFLYTQGFSGKGTVSEGLRYGLYAGLLLNIPRMLIMYMWSLFPMPLLQAWAVTGLIETVLLGAVVGALYRA
jgi:hypothetical protein